MNEEQKIEYSRFEVIKSIEGEVEKMLPELLMPVKDLWQPSDFLPDMNSENWEKDLREFRERAKAIPDELMVVLIGDMITEEALPTYQTWLNRLKGLTDENGVSHTPWAKWSRGWTAEENRHGDLLNKYLYLSGRVNMRAVEVTVQNLINNGFDPQTENDPYLGFVYTSFQERATKISHRNVARLAQKAGDESLQKMCGIIAGDEARHEKAYKFFMSKVVEADPVQAVISFAKMMKKKIVMPAHLMTDGNDDSLFTRFSEVAQRVGVYTAKDYADIIANLVREWNIPSIKGLSDAAARAQDYLSTLADRYRKIADRIPLPTISGKFSWIFNREV